MKSTRVALVLALVTIALASFAVYAAKSTNRSPLNSERAFSMRSAPIQAAHFSSRTFDVDAAEESLVIDEPDVSADFVPNFGMQFTLSIGSAETGSVCYTFVKRTSATSCATACAAGSLLTCTLTGDVTTDGFPVRPGQSVTEWITGEDCLCAEASEANVDVTVKQISRYAGG